MKCSCFDEGVHFGVLIIETEMRIRNDETQVALLNFPHIRNDRRVRRWAVVGLGFLLQVALEETIDRRHDEPIAIMNDKDVGQGIENSLPDGHCRCETECRIGVGGRGEGCTDSV